MTTLREERQANIDARDRIRNRVERDILGVIEVTAIEFDPFLRPLVVDSEDAFHFVERLPWETFRTDIDTALVEGYEDALREGWLIGIEFSPFREEPQLEDPNDDSIIAGWIRERARQQSEIILENSKAALAFGYDRMVALGIGPGEAADRIAPMVGLTEPEARSIDNRFIFLVAAGLLTAQEIQRARREQRDRLRLQRARRIAEHEAQAGIQQGERAFIGALIKEELVTGPIFKTWWTVADERVCPICRPLHGIQMKFEELFSSSVGLLEGPPAHVICRCFTEFTSV